MLNWLRQLWKEWFGPWDEIERRISASVILYHDYAQNPQQLAMLEKKLRAGERPRWTA